MLTQQPGAHLKGRRAVPDMLDDASELLVDIAKLLALLGHLALEVGGAKDALETDPRALQLSPLLEGVRE